MKQFFHLTRSTMSALPRQSDLDAYLKALNEGNTHHLLMDWDICEETNLKHHRISALSVVLENVLAVKNLKSKPLPQGIEYISVFLGLGFEDFATKLELLKELQLIESQLGLPIYVEIARGSVTQDLPTLCILLKQFSDLKLIADIADIHLSHELIPIGTHQYPGLINQVAKNIKALRANVSTTEHNIFLAQDYIRPLIPRCGMDIHFRNSLSALNKDWKRIAGIAELDFVVYESQPLDELIHEHSPLRKNTPATNTKDHQAIMSSLLKKAGIAV